MNFIFFGNTDFSEIVLNLLVKGGYSPTLVVCNPDRPVGRKKVITASPVKKLAIDINLPLYQPERLDENALQTLRSGKYDFFILADYGKIFSKDVLEIPRLGTIGVHVSLLPRYRGASPMQSSILNGEKETAVTLYLLDEKLDHGPILAIRKFPLAHPTFLGLKAQSAILAGNLLNEILPKFLTGEIIPTPQDELLATYTKKFSTEDAFVDPELLTKAQGEGGAAAVEIDRKIRALNPEPGVWTYAKALANSEAEQVRYGAGGHMRISDGDKRVKLLEAEIQNRRLVIKKIQIEGERSKSIS